MLLNMVLLKGFQRFVSKPPQTWVPRLGFLLRNPFARGLEVPVRRPGLDGMLKEEFAKSNRGGWKNPRIRPSQEYVVQVFPGPIYQVTGYL